MDAGGSNKRRRTADSLLDGLPDVVLTHVASYLAKPSCALFAVALSAPSSSWRECNGEARRQPPTTAIIASSFYGGGMEINFADVEKSLSSKLTDDDLHALLVCVDARNTLKRLKLAGCVKIIGHGLEPIRGSLVLEQIDLSLIGHESAWAEREREQLISKDAVIPILESIVVNAGGSTLKHVALPRSWRSRSPIESQSQLLVQFVERYNQLLENRNAKCSQCDEVCRNEAIGEWVERGDYYDYGMQRYTCWKCIKHFCSGDNQCQLNHCARCDKYYCGDCTMICKICRVCRGCKGCSGGVALTRCNECENDVCEDCIETCKQCHATGCIDCLNALECENEGCDAAHCNLCEEVEGLFSCEGCGSLRCDDCRFSTISNDWNGACQSCVEILANDPHSSQLPESFLQRLHDDKEALRLENQNLRQEVENLRQENENLRSTARGDE